MITERFRYQITYLVVGPYKSIRKCRSLVITEHEFVIFDVLINDGRACCLSFSIMIPFRQFITKIDFGGQIFHDIWNVTSLFGKWNWFLGVCQNVMRRNSESTLGVVKLHFSCAMKIVHLLKLNEKRSAGTFRKIFYSTTQPHIRPHTSILVRTNTQFSLREQHSFYYAHSFGNPSVSYTFSSINSPAHVPAVPLPTISQFHLCERVWHHV